MDNLEDFLKQKDLDILNRRSIIQHSVIDIPRNKETKSKYDKAEGNAQLFDFISLVGQIVESIYSDNEETNKVSFLPRSKTYFLREDPDQKIKNPAITFQVMNRKIKDKTSKSPQLRESGFEKGDDRTYEVFTTDYVSIVRFQFLALEYNTAFKLMDEFEDMMMEYKGFIKSKGIVNYYMLEQQADDYNTDFRDVVDQLTLDYYVETQKNRVIFRENAKTLIINGEAAHEDFSPIPANPEYENK